jgi:pimeloyl-ACP methyl ester carboxylesterase
VPLLQDRYRLVMPDLRGHGWTDAPSGGYDKEQLATDLLGLLDALELPQVGLVGHDWGGWTGFLAALRAPERFRAFLALGIVHPFQRPTLGRALQSWRLAYQVGLSTPLVPELLLRSSPQLVEQVVAAGSTRREVFADGQARTYGEVLQDPARARASVLLYRSMVLREGLPVVLGRYRDRPLRVPTRLVVGDGTRSPARRCSRARPAASTSRCCRASATSSRRRPAGRRRAGARAVRLSHLRECRHGGGDLAAGAAGQLAAEQHRRARGEELPWFAALRRAAVVRRARPAHRPRRLRAVAARARAAAAVGPDVFAAAPKELTRVVNLKQTCSSSAWPSRSSSRPSRAWPRPATSRCCARRCCATPGDRLRRRRRLRRRGRGARRLGRARRGRGSSTRSCAATPGS